MSIGILLITYSFNTSRKIFSSISCNCRQEIISNIMSNHDVYVSLNLSKDSDEDNRKSTYVKTKEQLGAACNAIVEEESMILDFQVLIPFSKNEARDIEEALNGDYKENYHDGGTDIFLLPEFRSFQERLENSTFDNMNIESAASKYRFLVPFVIKAELSPVLAFSEVLLSIIHIMTFTSVLMNGLTAITMFAGGCSLFFLLSIVHFWYGMSRYPSIWNSFVPIGLKGSTLDRNFAEIREICGYHHNGHNRTNSQIMPFVITLPFTIVFHMTAFLVTMAYYLLRISKKEGKERIFIDPVIISIFLSNGVITALWLLGGTIGIVFATLSIIFNQKVYNSLLFKKSLKDFCISLVFGNLLVVHEKLTTDVTEIALSEKPVGHDLEQVIKRITEESKAGGDKQYSSIRYLPPLLGASNSSSTSSLVEQEKATSMNVSTATQQKFHSAINSNTSILRDDDERSETNQNNESPPENFIDEIFSQQSDEVLQYVVTVISGSQKLDANKDLENDVEEVKQNHDDFEVKTLEVERSTKSSKKKFFGLSRRMFSSPRNKYDQSKKNSLQNQIDDELSAEFLNPSDVHLDIENYPGTMEWRNAISESIQRFKIKSYTLRKHNWVMNQMHGKPFFIKENGERRRKLKRKEIKKHCKAFHDKQLHFNSQISGILDDLKDLKKNHNNSKSVSDHTRNGLAKKIPLHINEKADSYPNVSSTGEERMRHKEKYTMSDSNYQAPKYDAASTTKESLAESSQESTISTLTQSFIFFEHPNDRSTIESTSTFRDAINGLLDCTPWIDNINLLKDIGPIKNRNEGHYDMIDVQNTSPRNNGTQKDGKRLQHEDGSENLIEAEDDGNRRGSPTNVKRKPYWHNFVDEKKTINPKFNKESKEETSRDFIPAVDLSSGKRRKFYPWRSDLQKKKTEKARENRSQSKDVAFKQIISIWKKRKTEPYQIILQENVIYSSQNSKMKEKEKTDKFCKDDRHEMVENHRCHIDNHREIDLKPYDEVLDDFPTHDSYSRTHLRKSRDDDPEMNTSPKHSIHNKTSTIDYERECGCI